MEPSFVTLSWSPSGALRLVVGLAGGTAGVQERAGELATRLAALEGVRVAARESQARPRADCVLRLGFRPADLARVLADLRQEAEAAGIECDAEIEAALGVADVRVRGSMDGAARMVEGLRRRLGANANVLLRRAAPELKRRLGSFGRLGAPAELLSRVKREFDPGGVLSPGRVPWA